MDGAVWVQACVIVVIGGGVGYGLRKSVGKGIMDLLFKIERGVYDFTRTNNKRD